MNLNSTFSGVSVGAGLSSGVSSVPSGPLTRPASALPFDATRPVGEMSMVELAQQLEQVTGWIEAHRVREREARAVYQAVANEVEATVKQIKDYAERLVQAQHRKMSSFNGLLGTPEQVIEPKNGDRPMVEVTLGRSSSAVHRGPVPRNISDAILAIWAMDRYAEPLTTEEIAEALPEVGYESEAAATSLRSSINQALAKLCRVGRVVRFRNDGSQIDIGDHTSRARKYLAATRLPEPTEV